MTLAAKELAMTQPGVTQHIRNLETILNVKFFQRLGKRLVPSKEAENFYDSLNESLINIENALSHISQKDRQFMGNVRIGVPIEFGNTLVLPNLASVRRKFPQVKFFITYGLPHELNGLIMDGKLDFAFIDQYQINPAIKTEVVYKENLILCCSQDYYDTVGKSRKEKVFFESLNYIAYQPGEPILRDWFERAYGFKKIKLQVASYSFDVQGVASLVKSSMGVGVLPEHVFLKLKSTTKLYQFRPQKGVVNNPISLAYLEQRWNIPLNQFVINHLKELIMNIQPK